VKVLLKGVRLARQRRKRFDRPGRTAVVVVAILVAGAALGLGGLKAAHKLHLTTSSSVAQASAGYGLDAPTAAAVIGPHLFVVNEGGNSISVLDASTGAHLSTIAGSTYQFDHPTAIIALGPDLFVANGAGDSVTELNGTRRSPIRTISGAQLHLADPIALAGAHGRLYVLSAGGSVTGIRTASGGLIGVAVGSQFGFNRPKGVAVSGNALFVTNSGSNSVTRIDDRSMTFVKTLRGPGYRLQKPTGAAVDGRDLWVTNEAGDSVTEISTKTSDPVRVVVDHTNLPTPGPITVGDGYVFTVSPPGDSPMVTQVMPDGSVPWMMCNTNGPYLFSNPQAAVVSGENLWVVNKASSSLTEMNTDSGALIRTIS
jgi:DNA-binding beta-propeller fold protein YncE